MIFNIFTPEMQQLNIGLNVWDGASDYWEVLVHVNFVDLQIVGI